MSDFERVAPIESELQATGDEPPERSGLFRAAIPARSQSSAFWGLDLYQGFPRIISREGVRAVRGEFGRISDFLKREFPSFTEEAQGVVPTAIIHDAKRRYLQTACDLIELRHEQRTVGVLVGAPEDWSSYYVRIFAVSRDFQRPALIRQFGRDCLFEPLRKYNVERVVAETSPANLAMSRLFSELHFHVTGHQLSERWGSLVRYTKFLDPACEAAFHERFGSAAPPRSENAHRSRTE